MSINLEQMKGELNQNKDKYLDLTHQLNNYNEIYNVNFYLDNLGSLERDKLDRTNNNIKSKVLRMKQEYMVLDYSEYENKLRSNIMYWSIVISAILFCLCAMYSQEKLSKNMLILISLVLIILYFLIVLFMIFQQSQRRKYAFNQYYWANMKKTVV